MDLAVDGATLGPGEAAGRVTELCAQMEQICDDGWYAAVEVNRPWSRHNPRITGEFARPRAIRGYLERELTSLLERGAAVLVKPSRPALALDDPALFRALDEWGWDLRAKKLFLFGPERQALSMERLAHYCGTPAESFERYVLFTNYGMHVEAFRERFPDAEGPNRAVQMPAWHARRSGGDGVSIIDIGVGPSNAKTITDHLAVVRPDAMVMIGHCAGLRNHQDVGDFVLATGYLRLDHILDDVLPTNVPVVPNPRLNGFLLDALERHGARYRIGTVCTVANRNWELNQRLALPAMEVSRSVAVDMESATIAANGFRFRIPHATLLAVSDKPIHGTPKLAGDAARFYAETRAMHVALALECMDAVRAHHPGGIPTADLRSSDEPLLGAPPDVD